MNQHEYDRLISLEPKGNGFIYILENKSMPGIYKIGFTAGSIKERIESLNSTGVPTTFVLVKAYEIPRHYLRIVEKSAHEHLKSKKAHHAKEFFSAALIECEEAVQDAIYKHTSERSVELVGAAEDRSKNLQKKIEESRIEKEEGLKQERLERERDELQRVIYKEHTEALRALQKRYQGLNKFPTFTRIFKGSAGKLGYQEIPQIRNFDQLLDVISRNKEWLTILSGGEVEINKDVNKHEGDLFLMKIQNANKDLLSLASSELYRYVKESESLSEKFRTHAAMYLQLLMIAQIIKNNKENRDRRLDLVRKHTRFFNK